MRYLLLLLLCLSINVSSAYEWNEYFTLDHPIYNANFEFEDTEILCTDGLIIRTNSDWELFENNDLPIISSVKLDDENLLTFCGNGSYSDGVYIFNLNTHDFELIDWFISPQFLYYNTTNSRYYLGCDSGLFRSYNGMKWIRDNTWEISAVNSMNNYNEHFVLTKETSVYNWEYSTIPDLAPQQNLGELELDEIDEASGIVASRLYEDVFWTFNDSGGEPAVYAFNSAGEHLGIYTLDGVSNRDWEDIAIGGGPEYGQYIYVADIGDNDNQYDTKYIYRFNEPIVNCNQAPVTETIYDVETISVQYPSANYDAETLMHDPLTNDLYIVTKRALSSPTGTDKVLLAEYPQSTTTTIVMEEVAQLDYPPSLDPFGGVYYGATAGEISPLGDEILIKTYTHVYHWKRHQDQSLEETFQNDHHSVTYTLEPQGEALCWEPHCNGYFTVSEEPVPNFPAHLYFYDLNSWQQVNDYTSVQGLQFTSDGTLYAFMPGESYSSGLYSSTDFGENWDVCFYNMNISSLTLDSYENIFLGWEDDGVGFWEAPMDNPLMMNSGLDELQILQMVDFPIIDTPSVLACTQSGAYYLTDYTEAENYELPISNYELRNYPNPFNPSTTISFTTTESTENTELGIYNLKGQKVKTLSSNPASVILSPSKDEGQRESNYNAVWNGLDENNDPVSSGVYLYQLIIENDVKQTRKMLMLK